MAARALSSIEWTWSAVIAGVFTSLVIQILLTMLGFGIGLLSVDMATVDASPQGAGWVAFVWWAVAGVIAAFAGGAVAAALSADDTQGTRVVHALASWAIATVIVVGAASLGAGSAANITSNMSGPSYAAAQRMDYVSRPNRATTGSVSAPSRAQVEEARRHFAYVMLASFLTLLVGAGAAYGAAATMDRRTTRKIADASA